MQHKKSINQKNKSHDEVSTYKIIYNAIIEKTIC